MKKIIFSAFLVFALVFSFGNPAQAQSNADQTVLQNLYQQLESIRLQLGGLVSRATTTIDPVVTKDATVRTNPSCPSGQIWSVTIGACVISPVTVAPSTAYVFNACNGSTQSAFSLCMEICRDAGGSWGTSVGSSGASQGCYASSSITMPSGNTMTTTTQRTNPSCPVGQIWSVSIGACVLPPVQVNTTARVNPITDVTGSPLDPENLQDDRILPVSHVMNLQLLLNRSGFDVGNADGKAGPKTQAQIRAFQAKYGFPVTGVANYTALNQMNHVVANIQDINNETKPTTPVMPSSHRYVYSCEVTGGGFLLNGTHEFETDNNLGESFSGGAGRIKFTCSRSSAMQASS
ncbi:MAG: peptidoglycan-binding protein [Candidatus Pacebacteria bacterium]|nr:peptidoglycan-binding protein [Candidatus Paceibacterota bacterium]